MKIPFSLPFLENDIKNEVIDVFDNTGWLTSGPKVISLEKELKRFTNSDKVICVNSWTSGAMLVLRWFGIGPGDEVIIPSYTYAATALCVLNMGAKPVMVDVNDDFNLNSDLIFPQINERTKAIIAVDIGGWPADYDKIMHIVKSKDAKNIFSPKSENQKKLGRILVISDAAHSLGAKYKGKNVGEVADITVFSFHSVKNITTGEGGAVCLKLPKLFDANKSYRYLKALSLNGQNKSAFEKNQPGSWKYDIIDQGLKINMPDLCAAVGLSQLRIYQKKLLPERKKIFNLYFHFLSKYKWAILPKVINENTETSYHLFLLRIREISEEDRDLMIHYITNEGVGVNVHYIPMPYLTLFKKLNYQASHYPKTIELYKNEISLPVYNNLTEKSIEIVCSSLINAYDKIKNK